MFRFEGLDIWRKAIDLSDRLFDIADKSDKLKYYRFSEQLPAAATSITNNIAEGSASNHNKEFSQFLNISRRSVFECVNILIIYNRRGIISLAELEELKEELLSISKMISAFRKTLLMK
jgi:four helix bundle protein